MNDDDDDDNDGYYGVDDDNDDDHHDFRASHSPPNGHGERALVAPTPVLRRALHSEHATHVLQVSLHPSIIIHPSIHPSIHHNTIIIIIPPSIHLSSIHHHAFPIISSSRQQSSTLSICSTVFHLPEGIHRLATFQIASSTAQQCGRLPLLLSSLSTVQVSCDLY